jgi:hypothetical protein
LNAGVAPGNGAVMNWATTDMVNPEDYYGAQGVAASQHELQAHLALDVTVILIPPCIFH